MDEQLPPRVWLLVVKWKSIMGTIQDDKFEILVVIKANTDYP